MTNDDLKRFFPENASPQKSKDFVRYTGDGKIPGDMSGAEIIDIGREQVIIDKLIYPTMTVSQAKEIYNKHKLGKNIRIKFSVPGLSLEFDVISNEEEDYFICGIIHNRICYYLWGRETPDNTILKPKFNEKYLHTIKIEHTTSSGSWNYQFYLRNNYSEKYTQLTQIGHYLYENLKGISIPATGLCVFNNEKYFITDLLSETDNMVTVGMYKVGDGTRNTISTGVVDVTDYIQ